VMPHPDAWRVVCEIAKRRIGATIPSEISGATGLFSEKYQQLRERVNPEILLAALPAYCDTKGAPLSRPPGHAGAERKRWHEDWRKFYEDEVQPKLDAISKRNKQKEQTAVEARAANVDAMNARAVEEVLDGPEVLALSIALDAPHPGEIAAKAYEQQLESMDFALNQIQVFDKVRLLSALLQRHLDSTKHKTLSEALHALELEHEEAPKEEEEIFAQNAFNIDAWATASNGGEGWSSAGAGSSASDGAAMHRSLGDDGSDGGVVHRSLSAYSAPVDAATSSAGTEEEEEKPKYRSFGEEPSPPPKSKSRSVPLTLRQKIARLTLAHLYQALEPGLKHKRCAPALS